MIKETYRLELCVAAGIGFILGAMAMCLIILAGGTDQFLTDQECNNLTIQAYQYGYTQAIFNVANYTTFYGNFTYMSGDSIQVKSIEETCYIIFPQLNIINGGK